MEVEMILLNLTNEILENTRKEGREVVEVEMNPTQMMVEAVEEVDLIQQAVGSQPTWGHYWTKRLGKSWKFSLEIKTRSKNS